MADHQSTDATIVLSISPTNQPSRQIAQHFGFVQVGTVEDEEDGPEDLFVLKLCS